jgi:glutamyl-tRNA(Gln) amidotransferase subunit D
MVLEPGDYVKLQLAKREVEGRLLESHEKDVVLLKLKSGYNVGILKENILDSKVVRKFKAEKSVPVVRKKGELGKKKIGLVVTGGTIASKLDSRTGGVTALTSVEEFAKFYPKMFERVNVKKIEVPFMAMSNDMSSVEWIEIAKVVESMLNDSEIEGVVVTHGTDTLHYTAAALSFFLRDLNKPVVLTYAQRSIDRASSDADINLQCAAEMAISDCAEVLIVGHASMNDDFCYAMLGTKVRKMHSSRRDAFKSVNVGPLAKINLEKGVEFLGERRPRNKEKVLLDGVFNDKVALIKFYPGAKPEVLDWYSEKGFKGLVIELLGLGQIASSKSKNSWVGKLKKLIKEGVVICGAPQTIYGRLNPKVYSEGRELEELGVVFLEDMLAETAFVKLGWVLGHNSWRGAEKVREKMLENVSGEFNELLSE